jgi:UDPglucose--hexose-1-phosphate uridylyltransferase
MNVSDYPHKRYNPLLGEWILCSPHRTKRPWQGATEPPKKDGAPAYDPSCYLCPGNERAGGIKNPDYKGAFSFVNDFSALLPDSPVDSMDLSGLIRAEAERGLCKVICFSPRHDLTLPRMDLPSIKDLIDVWAREYLEIGGSQDIAYVQIFENRGAIMGCSNPHPHCQIWASSSVPDIPAREGERQAARLAESGKCLLCEYLEIESKTGERLIAENASFAALVPFWAVWPYEAMILPKRHMASIDEMSEAERNDLAALMKDLGIRFDNLFKTDFPYSMGIHQAPTDGEAHPEWHFHLHYLPPLLRSASVRKFMVGYELLASPQRDITAESAAQALRGQPSIHYRDQA